MAHGISFAMKQTTLLVLLVLLLTGCATRSHLYWDVRELVLAPGPMVALTAPGDKLILAVNKQTVQKIFLSHRRITRSANVQTDLLLVDGDEPNAFAALVNERRVIAINVAMAKLIGEDIEEFAALLGHETAHWARGHVEAGKTRSNTIQAVGTMIGVGLGMAGVPGAGYISGFGANLIEASYSRDDEREADAFGVEYMLANGFDPGAAVRLHEKMLKLPSSARIPFLSSHPASEERIENLKKLIEAKKSELKVTERAGSTPHLSSR
jgi:predicted Zn-dependent protease